MRGLYNGVTMKLRYLFPSVGKVISLSKEGQQRLAWFDWYEGHGRRARLTCRHFGISPDTFYRWKRRFNPKSLRSLEDDKRSRRPKKLRTMTTLPEVIGQVVEIRRGNPEKSKYEIKEELRRKGISLGSTTIQKIINRHLDLLNTQHHRQVRSVRRRAIARIKAARELKNRYPGSLIQIDTKHLYILNRRFYLFTAIDCHSRLGYVSAFKSGSSQSGQLFLQELLGYFPFKIESMQTDNGSEYLANFHYQGQQLGINHYFTDPQCPKQNGRVERFIQTATYEFFNWQEDLLDDLEAIRAKCQEFNFQYNHQRLHQALGYKTPMEYLKDTGHYVKVNYR